MHLKCLVNCNICPVHRVFVTQVSIDTIFLASIILNFFMIHLHTVLLMVVEGMKLQTSLRINANSFSRYNRSNIHIGYLYVNLQSDRSLQLQIILRQKVVESKKAKSPYCRCISFVLYTSFILVLVI